MDPRPSRTEESHWLLERPRRRSQGLECQEVGDELMVMDARSDRVHVLNLTMAAVWKLCDGGRSCEQIAQGLSEVVDCAEVEDLLATTRDALRSLAGLELIEPVESVEPVNSRGAQGP